MIPIKIKWRDDEYDFFPRVINGGGDKESNLSNVHAPIFGADTESVQLDDRYEPQCFTFSDSIGQDHIVYLRQNDFALKSFLSFIVAEYSDMLQHNNQAFIYFHNLEYDWLQLVKNDKRLLEIARIGVGLTADMKLFRIGNYNIILKKDGIFSGSAPHFTIRFEARKGGCNVHFRDTFSFFPGSLAKVSKDLKLDDKMDRQEDLGFRDWRDVEDDPNKAYFEEYAKLDAKNTRGIGEAIRSLHLSAGMHRIRASAPSYAIARVFQLMGPDRSITTGSHDESVMQLIFDTYRGGRTGGIYHGAIKDLSVLDFHSSYPASMLALPSFSGNMAYISIDDLRLENVLPILEETGNAFLRVSGTETDPHYPALITTHNGKLTPVYGEFRNIATTGVELLVGIKSGTLEISEIHECVVLLDMDEKPYLPFKEFALSSYGRKANAEKGSVMYTSAKLELNSSYGKLIESRNQTLVGATDYAQYFPYIEGMEKDFGNYYYQKYIEALEAGQTLEEIYDEIIQEVYDGFPESVRGTMRNKMFGDFSTSGRIYGRYVIPAAASLITATSRARLCGAMKVLKALYWDTDSVFISRPINGPTDLDQINIELAESDGWFPKNVKPLRIGDELGDLDAEITGATGYLAGIKRYYLATQEGKKKSAIHGIPALKRESTEDVIRALATGENYKYDSKPRPLKAKEAKNPSEIGSFRTKSYRSDFHLDERLQWEKTDDGYIGSVKPFVEMGVKELTDEEYQTYLERLYRSEWKLDPIREACLKNGFIKIIAPGEMYRGEYDRLTRSTRAKYFRKEGVPIDVFAQAIDMKVAELLDKLGG